MSTYGPPPEWDRLLSYSQKNLPDDILQLIEKDGVDPSHANRVGQSALHVASLWGHVESVRVLIEKGASLQASNQITGATPLHCAVQTSKGTPERRYETVRMLLEAGANPSTGDFYGSVPYDYVDENDDSKLKELLKPKTPEIFTALQEGDTETLKNMLSKDPSAANVRHLTQTPLLWTIEHRILSSGEGVEILQLLLEHGADPNASLTVDRKGHLVGPDGPSDVDPALHQVCLALKEAYRADDETDNIATLETTAKLLAQYNAAKSPDTIQLLHDAARRGMVPMANFLIGILQIDPNASGRQGMSPLQFAARSGKTDMVRFLLSQKSIDVEKADDRGQTALGAARANHKTGIVELLEEFLKK